MKAAMAPPAGSQMGGPKGLVIDIRSPTLAARKQPKAKKRNNATFFRERD
jgi:hypothetical protein